MEEKTAAISRKGKILIRIGIAVAAAAILTILLFFALKKDAGYRTVRIYEVQGNVSIERDQTGKMDAYENLLLQNGDRLQVGAASSVRLKMDEDKYAVVEENSELEVLAEGDSANSRTELVVAQGSVTTDIQSKLSRDSSYKVSTPNSVMAVRGTIFQASVSQGSDGTPISRVKVFRGKVGFSPKDKEGNVQEEIPVEEGKEMTMVGDEEPVMSDITDFSNPFETSPGDDPVAASAEEAGDGVGAGGDGTASDGNDANADGNNTDSDESGASADGEEADSDNSGVRADGEEADSDNSGTSAGGEKATTDRDDAGRNTAAPKNKTSKKPSRKPSKDSSKDSVEEKEKPKATKKPASSKKTQAPANPPLAEEKPEPTVKAPTPTEKGSVLCTVIFQYKGKVFATKKVEQGETASKPRLIPPAKGKWDYDFSKPVTKDLVIEYVLE